MSLKQVKNGKSFEYALAYQLKEIAEAKLVENRHLCIAQGYYNESDKKEQTKFMKAAREAIIFLAKEDTRIQPKLCEVRLQSDQEGGKGDVRDVIINTPFGEVGISAKNRHFGVKNPRLSDKIDFGKKWIGHKVSQAYWDTVLPIFREMRNRSKKGQLWREVEDKENTFYVPLMHAFNTEMQRIYDKDRKNTPSNLLHYLLGYYDFYKVTKDNGTVIIQSFNINGDLKWGKRLSLPTFIEHRRNTTKTTTLYSFDKGWQISFRIHNAESRVTSSLKFDVQLTGMPHNLSKHEIDYLF